MESCLAWVPRGGQYDVVPNARVPIRERLVRLTWIRGEEPIRCLYVASSCINAWHTMLCAQLLRSCFGRLPGPGAAYGVPREGIAPHRVRPNRVAPGGVHACSARAGLASDGVEFNGIHRHRNGIRKVHANAKSGRCRIHPRAQLGARCRTKRIALAGGDARGGVGAEADVVWRGSGGDGNGCELRLDRRAQCQRECRREAEDQATARWKPAASQPARCRHDTNPAQAPVVRMPDVCRSAGDGYFETGSRHAVRVAGATQAGRTRACPPQERVRPERCLRRRSRQPSAPR
jgi:hypothetical protein